MSFLDEVINLIDESIDENCLSNITEGNIIKDGYSPTIDEYRATLKSGHVWISEYQNSLISSTGVKNLKIKHIGNIWYFIEVPKSTNLDVQNWFFHKQTLSNVHRYGSPDLDEFEIQSKEAETLLYKEEYEVFTKIREKIALNYNKIHESSRNTAFIDFISNGAYISLKYSLSQPVFSSWFSLEVESWSHPIVSSVQKDFVKNNIYFNKKERVHIITGPNMWWKSTFLRQNALLILVAHIGYDVFAQSMKTAIVDKVFSRVWSGDNLYLGQSTFMVEMQEVSFILRSATKNSFIIIDEIWRGTSTLDGMSLAWAILKNIHDVVWAKVIFATHYHELVDHSASLKSARNFSVAVGENSESLIFLRKIIPGWMKKSYGIEVAKIAGLSTKIISEATNMLKSLEKYEVLHSQQLQISISSEDQWVSKTSHELIEKINSIDINALTPIDWLNELHKIKQLVKKMK